MKDCPSKLCWNRSGEDPRLKVRLTEQCQKVCGAERRLHQKGRLCNKRRLGLVHQRIRQLMSMRWVWRTSYVGRVGSTRILHGMRAKRATRPAQWYARPDHSQERPRRRQQRKLTTHGYSESLMLFMPGRRETEKQVLVDVKELETKIKMYILYIVRQMLRVSSASSLECV